MTTPIQVLVEKTASDWDDLNGWSSFVDHTFELNSMFTIVKELSQDRPAGKLFDGTPCNVWRFPKDYPDYKVIHSYYTNNHPFLPKIYAVSNSPNSYSIVVVSETFDCTWDKWICDHPAKANEIELYQRNILYPFRSLLDSIVAVYDICGDFQLAESCVYVIESENTVQLKVGFVEVVREKKLRLKCMTDVVPILRNWVLKENSTIPLDLNSMQKISPEQKNKLKMLRIHPIFYSGYAQTSLLDFIIKLDRVLCNAHNYQTKSLIAGHLRTAFQGMGCLDIAQTGWYLEQRGCTTINKCWNAWIARSQQAEAQEEKKKDLGLMIAGMSYIAIHINEHLRPGLSEDVCVGWLEKVRPGCWAAAHFVAMEMAVDDFALDPY